MASYTRTGSPARSPALPPARTSTMNMHYLQTCVILENQKKSSVIIWTAPNEHNPPLQFRTFTGPPSQHGIDLNRDLQVPILGTLGVFHLLSGWFIIVITENHMIGSIEEKPIFLATKFNVYPIPAQTIISEEEKKVQTQFLSNLNNMLYTCGFYYSYEYDITHTRQRQTRLDPNAPVWNRVDPRFYWNLHFMAEFRKNNITDWILPVMDGFVETSLCFSPKGRYLFILISRREWYRTGARFLTRGSNPDGNVANFAETEQIVIFEGRISSWVQTRGSIPLIWFQPSSINPLKAKPTVVDSPFSKNAFRTHLSKQMAHYGKHTLVSLIDHKGNEQKVGEAFETKMRLYNNPNANYIAFDFHEECKNNNYARLQILVDQVKDSMDQNQYFIQDNDGSILLEQIGNIRTNCIDCLDRTNVVQSQFGRYMLKHQLAGLGLMSVDDEYDRDTNTMLNNIWTNNADTLSKRYTGVGALKTDFTRTGKRSAKGAVADGVKSVTRLYHSTFNDDSKQDATEFLLGRFSFSRTFDFQASRDDVVRFKVIRKTSWESRGKNVLLELNSSILLEYNPETAITKRFALSELVQISRYARHYCGITLLFHSSSLSKKYIFSSTSEREDFIQKLPKPNQNNNNQQNSTSELINFDLPSVPSTPPSLGPEVPIKFFIGSVNHSIMTYGEPPSLEGFIPRDRDIYVLGAQNIHYRVPRGFYLSSAAHWAFLIQQHLGEEFEVIKLENISNRLVTIVLARSNLLYDISNVELSYTVLKPIRQESPAISSSKSSRSGFGGLLRSISNEVKKGLATPDSSSSYSEADYMGIAVSIRIFETSVCFINTNRCDIPFRVLDFDIGNDFHHVFLFGDVNPGHLNSYWIPLSENTQLGSVYWRTLLNSNLEGILTSRQKDTSSPLPISVCFSLKAARYIASQATDNARVIVSDLSANDLNSPEKPGKLFSPYLIIHSACTKRHARTGSKSCTNNPIWEDVLTLPTIPIQQEFLGTQYLGVSVYDQDEGYLIGKGVISIRQGVDKMGEVQDFVIRLSSSDESRGALRGKYRISLYDTRLSVTPTSSEPLLLTSAPSLLD